MRQKLLLLVIILFIPSIGLCDTISGATWPQVMSYYSSVTPSTGCTLQFQDFGSGHYKINQSCAPHTVQYVRTWYQGSYTYTCSSGGGGTTQQACDGTQGTSVCYSPTSYKGSGPGDQARKQDVYCDGTVSSYYYISEATGINMSTSPCDQGYTQSFSCGSPTVSTIREYIGTSEGCNHPPLVSSGGEYFYDVPVATGCSCVPLGTQSGSYRQNIGCIPAPCTTETCYFIPYNGATPDTSGSFPYSPGSGISLSCDPSTGICTMTYTQYGLNVSEACDRDGNCIYTITNPNDGSTHSTTVNSSGDTVITDTNADGLVTTSTSTNGTTTTTTQNPDGTKTTTQTAAGGSAGTTSTVINTSNTSTTIVTTTTAEGAGGQTVGTTVSSTQTGTNTSTETLTWTLPANQTYDSTVTAPTVTGSIGGVIGSFMANNPVSSILNSSGVDLVGATCTASLGTWDFMGSHSQTLSLDFCSFEDALNSIGIMQYAATIILGMMFLFKRGS